MPRTSSNDKQLPAEFLASNAQLASRRVKHSGRRLRILFCTWGYPPGHTGGAEQQAHLQARALTRLGFNVEAVCPRWPGTQSGIHEGIFVNRLRFINRPKMTAPSYMAALLWFLLRRATQFDLFHVHLGFLQADIVTVVARVVRRPVLVKLAASGPLGEIQRMRRLAFVTRYVGLRGADRVQAISQPIAAEVLGIGVANGKIARIPNGVDIDKFRPTQWSSEKAEARSALGIPQEAHVALFMGRLARHKGLNDLLEAWQLVRCEGRLLVLVGSHDTVDPAGELSEPRVSLSGWSDRPELYYRAADVFVLPSHVEGMSNALLEAMASGLAVVVTRIGAAEELIEPAISGELIEVGDHRSLARILEELLTDDERRARLGAAARSVVARRYSIDVVAAEISHVYEELL